MMAAIEAAKTGAEVILLEHKDRAGRKLLSTGNGRCNLTNLHQDAECYRCGKKEFPAAALKRFSVERTLDFFEDIGILPKSRNGYIYPNSDQASSVLEALLQEVRRRGIRLICSCHVVSAQKKGQVFMVRTDQGDFYGDALILAAGSRAAPVTGSDGSGYELAERFGHRIIAPLPALVQLRCREKHYRQLAGIRTEAVVTIEIDGRPAASDRGELQLTDYGISGIPTFQVSRFASVALHNEQNVTAVIDFLPQMTAEEMKRFIGKRAKKLADRSCGEWMNGMLNGKLSLVLLKLAGISSDQRVRDVNQNQWNHLMTQLKAYRTVVTGTNSYEQAQVCCGGVDVRQVDEKTMESRLVKNLYFCGEILDVDAICGGYNLQWAWSSGAVAGLSAAQKTERI